VKEEEVLSSAPTHTHTLASSRSVWIQIKFFLLETSNVWLVSSIRNPKTRELHPTGRQSDRATKTSTIFFYGLNIINARGISA
jgi:hypothetical protein